MFLYLIEREVHYKIDNSTVLERYSVQHENKFTEKEFNSIVSKYDFAIGYSLLNLLRINEGFHVVPNIKANKTIVNI